MIPKIIHYCWFGREAIPQELQQYMKTWREKRQNIRTLNWDMTIFRSVWFYGFPVIILGYWLKNL